MLLWLLASVVIIIGLVLALVYFSQDRMIFYPVSELVVTPAEIGLLFEDVSIEVTDAENIHGWFVPAVPDSGASGSSKTILFFHGNGGNISHRLETISFLAEMKADLLIIDYRGYGRSDGSPSEDGMYADAEAAYRWLTESKGVLPADIILFGRSLGGAVAINLASRFKCGGLIVESSFTSIPDMGRLVYPFLPVSWLARYQFDSISGIRGIQCPVLVTHSPDDDMIPFRMGKALFENAPEPKQFVPLTGGHNDLGYLDNPFYREAVGRLISGHD